MISNTVCCVLVPVTLCGSATDVREPECIALEVVPYREHVPAPDGGVSGQMSSSRADNVDPGLVDRQGVRLGAADPELLCPGHIANGGVLAKAVLV